ncbi:hypothetical protein HPB47_010447, partial [Ixodes persulcatus]
GLQIDGLDSSADLLKRQGDVLYLLIGRSANQKVNLASDHGSPERPIARSVVQSPAISSAQGPRGLNASVACPELLTGSQRRH